MKTILITGGAGFIGSNFVNLIYEKYNYKIINLDLLTYAGCLENLSKYYDNNRYEFIKADIADSLAVNEIFKNNQIDYIVNFAAESHVDNSISNPQIFIKTNILGTQILLDAAFHHWKVGMDEKGYPIYRDEVKFVQISTDEVYGDLLEEEKFTELTPFLQVALTLLQRPRLI